MPSHKKFLRQMSDLQIRLAEAEETLNAIRSGTVDALVVRTPRGEQLFTLKGSDQTYRALVEAMNEGAVTLKDGLVSYCNTRFAEMARMPLEKIFGTSIFNLIESADFPNLVRQIQKEARGKGSVQAVLHAADGCRVPVRLSASRFYSEGKATVGLVVTDITVQKEAERARQELSRNILNAQEQERQRVSRDLHDSVNQLLSSAQYRLNSSTFGNSDLARNVRPVRQLIERAIAEVRLISRNLRPGELDDLGLVAALRSLTHDFGKRTGVVARFKSDIKQCPTPMPKEVELTVYRIAQEALANVERHSRATRVDMHVTCSRNHATLTVRDNGKGFSGRKAPGGKSGWGLVNMNERTTLLGGSFAIKSLPGKGTAILVRIPFRNRVRKQRA